MREVNLNLQRGRMQCFHDLLKTVLIRVWAGTSNEIVGTVQRASFSLSSEKVKDDLFESEAAKFNLVLMSSILTSNDPSVAHINSRKLNANV